MSLRPRWATRDCSTKWRRKKSSKELGNILWVSLWSHLLECWRKLLSAICLRSCMLVISSLPQLEYSRSFLSTTMSPFQEPTSCTVLFSTQGSFSVSHVSWRGNWSTTNLLDGSCIVVRLWAVRKHAACLKSPLCLGKMLDKAWKIAQQLHKYRGFHTYLCIEQFL